MANPNSLHLFVILTISLYCRQVCIDQFQTCYRIVIYSCTNHHMYLRTCPYMGYQAHTILQYIVLPTWQDFGSLFQVHFKILQTQQLTESHTRIPSTSTRQDIEKYSIHTNLFTNKLSSNSMIMENTVIYGTKSYQLKCNYILHAHIGSRL